MRQLKARIFAALGRFTSWYRLFKVLATAQFLVTLMLPIFFKQLSTVTWLLSFALFAFFVASYALLRMAHHHDPNRKGLRGWFAHSWENLILAVWIILSVLMLVGVIKLGLFALFN